MGRANIFKRIKKSVRKYQSRQRANNRAALAQARRTVRAQNEVRRQSRRTADEIQAEGGFVWEGEGLPGKTLMEPVMGDNGWEWVPVTVQPRRGRSGAQTGSQSAAQPCGAPTADGTPCQRLGNCPIPSHKKARKSGFDIVHKTRPGDVDLVAANRQHQRWLSSNERKKWNQQFKSEREPFFDNSFAGSRARYAWQQEQQRKRKKR